MRTNYITLGIVMALWLSGCSKSDEKKSSIDDLTGTYTGTATILHIEYRENFTGGGNTIDTLFDYTDTTSYIITKSGAQTLLIPSQYGGAEEVTYSGNDYYMNRGWGGQELNFSPDIHKVTIYDSAFVWIREGQNDPPDLVKRRMVTRFVGYK